MKDKSIHLNQEYGWKMRAKVLLLAFEKHMAGDMGMTYKEIQALIGAKSISLANHYVTNLEASGMLIRGGGKASIRLTEVGLEVAGMLHVTQTGSNVIQKVLESPTRESFIDFREAAKRLDERYTGSCIDTLMRRKPGDRSNKPVREVNRKVTGAAVVKAMRSSTTYQEAADKLGINRKSLEGRITTIIKEMEKNNEQ